MIYICKKKKDFLTTKIKRCYFTKDIMFTFLILYNLNFNKIACFSICMLLGHPESSELRKAKNRSFRFF